MTLYFKHTGPLITFKDGMLRIADLNPEIETQWRMSRGEMCRLGWLCLVAALRR